MTDVGDEIYRLLKENLYLFCNLPKEKGTEISTDTAQFSSHEPGKKEIHV